MAKLHQGTPGIIDRFANRRSGTAVREIVLAIPIAIRKLRPKFAFLQQAESVGKVGLTAPQLAENVDPFGFAGLQPVLARWRG